MRVLIIVPAYNEEKSLPILIPKITELGWDSLVVNDCSTDHTAEILDANHYNHIDLDNNVGLAGVTQMGFIYAAENGYDAAIVTDGDGQHPPVYIGDLIQRIENGYDYVIGSRFVTEKKPYSMRMLGSRMLCRAIKIKTGFAVTDPTSGMRALGRKVLLDFAQNMNFIAEPDALAYVIKRKYKFIEVQVKMDDREGGVSYFHNPLKSIQFMFDTLVSILIFQW